MIEAIWIFLKGIVKIFTYLFFEEFEKEVFRVG